MFGIAHPLVFRCFISATTVVSPFFWPFLAGYGFEIFDLILTHQSAFLTVYLDRFEVGKVPIPSPDPSPNFCPRTSAGAQNLCGCPEFLSKNLCDDTHIHTIDHTYSEPHRQVRKILKRTHWTLEPTIITTFTVMIIHWSKHDLEERKKATRSRLTILFSPRGPKILYLHFFSLFFRK